MAKRGKHDGVLGLFYNESRAEQFYYTKPIMASESNFIQKKGKGIQFSNFEDLKPYKTGTLRGTSTSQTLIKKGLNVEEVSEYMLNVKKLHALHAGRIDLMSMGKQSFYYLLNSNKEFEQLKDQFEVIEPPHTSNHLFCSIGKHRTDGQEIVEKFNKALSEMKTDGTYDEILKRFGQK